MPDELTRERELLADLGGVDNVVEIEPCITRLRVEVRDPSGVDDAALKQHGAFGVVLSGRVVQVVVGPEADRLAERLERVRIEAG